MLEAEVLHDSGGLLVADVACRHRRSRGADEPPAGVHRIVYVRRGCFVRVAGGTQRVLDPTLGYFVRPDEEQRIDHPHDGGDDCTALGLDAGLLAGLWGGEPALPEGAVPIAPDLDLRHRLLLAACRRREDPEEALELGLELVARTLERADERRVASGRPATARARRAIAEGAREALAEEPGRRLPELARALAVSPHHLSRVFREVTGETISRHRMRLRARAALERLAGGEANLARLAADLGFADHAHLCRVVRRETGHAPAELRAALR
jgi:AraC-like DNA-binding protein